MGSFALPAWAVRATNAFEAYAPASWVAAGFAGFLLFAVGYATFAWARSKLIRARYDQNLYKRTGFVDPMAATFENKRIFLADFVLPSDPHIEGKTFINCDLIGPANIYIRTANSVNEHRLPKCDGVVIEPTKSLYNVIFMDNCTFRRCSFKRITLIVDPAMYESSKNVDWVNWINAKENSQIEMTGLEQPDQAKQIDSQPHSDAEVKPQQ
ncbi:hypothetical protein [Mesorhizobium erdmanii]|uniref:hypothetical protein n=1 Tax=Mesorhizobium erdmanii TaxID=1777866 RepID=UPI0012DB2064|nr:MULTISPECIES: hypothetical protein [Mesorhizobium]